MRAIDTVCVCVFVVVCYLIASVDIFCSCLFAFGNYWYRLYGFVTDRYRCIGIGCFCLLPIGIDFHPLLILFVIDWYRLVSGGITFASILTSFLLLLLLLLLCFLLWSYKLLSSVVDVFCCCCVVVVLRV